MAILDDASCSARDGTVMAGHVRLSRWAVALLLVAVVPAGVAGRAAAAPERPAAGLVRAAPLTAADAGQAQSLAASSGQPVEILPYRTDFSKTYAEPQGGFEDAESLAPY